MRTFLLITAITASLANGRVAVFTSIAEPVEVRSLDSGETIRPKIGRPFIPSKQQYSTDTGGSAFLAFSNKVSIGIGEDSEVIVEDYSYELPTDRTAPMDRELDVSNLQIQLNSGEIGYSTHSRSPLSVFTVETSEARIQIRDGDGIITREHGETFVHCARGRLTILQTDQHDELFLSQGQSVWIRKIDPTVEREDESELSKIHSLLIQATLHSNDRVLFDGSKTAADQNLPKAYFVEEISE